MTTPAPGRQWPDPGTDPRVAATVHLLHRRRGWAWALGGSLVVFVAFAAILTSLWPNATGALESISGVIFILLLALAVVALIMVITDTIRLRRREPFIRAHATSRTLVRHWASQVFGWVVLAGISLGAVVILPDQVNAVAYMLGAGNAVTFLPQSYTPVCGKLGCQYWTDGVLQTIPPVSATWPNQVPLGQSFSVRQPLWNGWGHPNLMNAGASAAETAGGLFIDLLTVFFVVRLVRRRRDAASMTVAAP